MQDNTTNVSGAAVYGSPATKKSVPVSAAIILALIAVAGAVCAIIFGIMAFNGNKANNSTANNNVSNSGTSTESTAATPQGSNVENVTIEENNVTVSNTNAATLAAEGSKVVNVNPDDGIKYRFTTTTMPNQGVSAWIDENNSNKVSFLISWDQVDSIYNDVKLKSTGTDSFSVDLGKKISDIHFGTFGQGGHGVRILLIMDDGTVKYSSNLAEIIGKNSAEFKDVPGVSNIIKLYNVSAYNYAGWMTTLAQTTDGSMYDLLYIIEQ